MDKLFSVPLKGGAITDVYFSDGSSFSLDGDVVYIADENSARYLPKEGRRLVIKPGEEEKRWETIDRILAFALDSGLARDSIFVAVGGGVVLDMVAFASSLYMRGARCILVPTTLLAAVDATLGGKTGIDYGGGKNLVGTFYPAESVIIMPETLKTLPEREYICGLGEVVKHAFLSPDRRLWDFLEANSERILARESDVLPEMIRLSLEVKISYITRDPEEKKGIRSALNLGHTFGHALESLLGFSISHGEGVIWGVARALEAGVRLGITPSDYASSAVALMDLFGFDTEKRIAREDLSRFVGFIKKDKKKANGAVRFVLMKGQGEPVLMPLEESFVESVVG